MNAEKTKIMVGSKTAVQVDIYIRNDKTEQVSSLAELNYINDCIKEIRRRLALEYLERQICEHRHHIWPVTFYGCETWTVKLADGKKLMHLSCGHTDRPSGYPTTLFMSGDCYAKETLLFLDTFQELMTHRSAWCLKPKEKDRGKPDNIKKRRSLTTQSDARGLTVNRSQWKKEVAKALAEYGTWWRWW